MVNEEKRATHKTTVPINRMATNSEIPTIDLSPFFNLVDDDEDKSKKKVAEMIIEACSEYGFFQVVNHGVPLHLLNKTMELSKIYFTFPDEEKLKCSPKAGALLPAGYSKQPEVSPNKNEYLVMFSADTGHNLLPTNPPEFKESLEELFSYLSKTSQILESIINDCLGLPPNFLKEFNHDRSWDLLVAFHYFPATEMEDTGLLEHEDVNCISFVVQDEAGGLEVRKDGQWIPVVPEPGKIVVNIGDVIQVLSNTKFKSATHRVVRPKGRSRHSLAFFYSLHGDKWVEPLPPFTKEIGEPAKYKGFFYKEYQDMRRKSMTHTPARAEDIIRITHYSV
ncbi:OLC1v1035127C1 [Oldenlandia corymbosa var. corymbosa]|uniref:OLC1v1035127C1 n=1 Tax=Oldenlandia corymbosa var. corymbosa TaxID=529605 RepID=A0AAV1CSZ6_OLDCO|nr:OLC1v1035127C1 [Oldenlandia corymbosa var. corymbosa]